MNHIQSNFSDYMLWKIFLRGVRLGNFWKNFFSLSVLFLFLCCCCCLFFFSFSFFSFFFCGSGGGIIFCLFFLPFFFFFGIDSKVKICETSQNCLLFQTRSIYGACCFSEEMHNLNSQTKMGNWQFSNISQFLLEFSMECHYIEAM